MDKLEKQRTARLLPLIITLSVVLGIAHLFVASVPERATFVALPAIHDSPVGTPATREELLRLVNDERAKVGVAPLAVDERLNGSAQRKTDDMAKFNYF